MALSMVRLWERGVPLHTLLVGVPNATALLMMPVKTQKLISNQQACS